MWKLLLLLTILRSADGFVQLFVVGVPDTNRTNVNKTLVEGWCNAPVGTIVTGAGLRNTPVKTVILAGEHDSVVLCAWLHNVSSADIGMYNFTHRRPPVELGEPVIDSWWGVSCKSCYNFTGAPFTDCFCGNHSSGCSHKCVCDGGWFGPSCEYDPSKRDYCSNGGHYGEVDHKPFCSCTPEFTGDRCQHRVVDSRFGALEATPLPLDSACMASTLCVVSLLGNIFLLGLLGWMLYSNRRRAPQELFLYHSLENPGAPKPLFVSEL